MLNRIRCTSAIFKTVRFGSLVHSAIGSNANFHSACMALSFIVGIPSGRFLPLLLGMYILLSGDARYPFFLSCWIPSDFRFGVFHSSLSIPAVRLPLFSVTRLTAKARPPNERVRICCKALTSLYFPSRKAFTIRTCRRRTFRLTFFQLISCHSIVSRRLAPVASMTTPNLRTPVFYFVLKLSCDETPFGSLHPFRSGQSLNPYPPHYKTTFAFSNIPYPLTFRLSLRFGFHFHGDNWAYLVPYKYLTSDLGSTNRPSTLHLCQKNR
ncbi:MAG: hypothetical protein OMM_06038 [Candidatus Magnetoglobus multicellularis str. Araruama]|uniref:Uncharacterized protein n=1 Tax=Candidatus Magnetoglobus multicellularis str. Araruama TaxID=890399 RepID=A0A1V1NSB3_9BACT|nr:MAG: hypothetical protein OMM_06038 [Candidatus Magnetoglobus multicellularis str. Araruama]